MKVKGGKLIPPGQKEEDVLSETINMEFNDVYVHHGDLEKVSES